MISTKQQDVEGMRAAGKLAAKVLAETGQMIRPGVTTGVLNEFAHDLTIRSGATPAPLNYKGFPKSICTSVNHVACHGIPGDKKLKDGDYISVDVTVILDGYHGDTCQTFPVKKIDTLKDRVSRCAWDAMWKGIELVRPGASLKEIGRVIEARVKEDNYSVCKMFCGHGIGKVFHEYPQVLHYYSDVEPNVILREGMFFTIEPIVNAGKPDVRILPDGWTAVTKDKKFSAQWEHTIMVTENGHEVMTQ